jgi:hypothetical protein
MHYYDGEWSSKKEIVREAEWAKKKKERTIHSAGAVNMHISPWVVGGQNVWLGKKDNNDALACWKATA